MPTLTPYEGTVYFDQEYVHNNPAGELGPQTLHISQDGRHAVDPYYLAICPTCKKKMSSIYNQRMYKCMECTYSISHESFLHKKNDTRKIEHARIRRERRAQRNTPNGIFGEIPIGIAHNNAVGGGYVNMDFASLSSMTTNNPSPWTTTGTYTGGVPTY
jgi:ribosomal protein L37AE/L43A